MDIQEVVYRDQAFLIWRFFRKLAKRHGEAGIEQAIMDALIERPDQGVWLGGGIRKARVAAQRKNKGKSGGYRYLFYRESGKGIHLMALLDKSEDENFDPSVLRELARILGGVLGKGGRHG